MPVRNIDNINITYDNERHIRNHFDVAQQVRCFLKQNSFTIWNEGQEHNYSYIVQNNNGAWRVFTRQVWIDDKCFKNIIDNVVDLIDRTSSGNRRYFS